MRIFINCHYTDKMENIQENLSKISYKLKIFKKAKPYDVYAWKDFSIVWKKRLTGEIKSIKL